MFSFRRLRTGDLCLCLDALGGSGDCCLSGGVFPTLDRVVDFLTIDGNVSRSLDSQSYVLAADPQDLDFDPIPDDQLFVFLASDYEHP